MPAAKRSGILIFLARREDLVYIWRVPQETFAKNGGGKI
jgi:hypothetical protein